MEVLISNLDGLSKDREDRILLANCEKELKDFNKQNEKTFAFSSIVSAEKYSNLLQKIFELLKDIRLSTSFKLECLCMLRLLSRDSTLVKGTLNLNNMLNSFMELLRGNPEEKTFDGGLNKIKVEVLKCLCNWIYHSPNVRQYFIDFRFSKNMLLEMIASSFLVGDYLFYQIRILFLMSALETEERNNMIEYGALDAMVNVLKKVSREFQEKNQLSEENRNILGEVLKALFNITLELSNVTSEKLVSNCCDLVTELQFMLTSYSSLDKCDENLSHISHLFVNLPKLSLEKLCSKTGDEKPDATKNEMNGYQIYYEGHDMSPVIFMLSALKNRMSIKEYNAMKEKTLSILTAFCYVCRINPLIRKYLREQLLPPLVVSDVRPEQRQDTRGDLVRLMTTVDVPLKNMAADFIFVLCKENPTRLIRYTGYGNSAGYLASRGLMIPCMTHVDGEYSDDELSDVDDEDLDVMIGAQSQPKEDIFANLTEEEKEVEAQKLMNMFDKLKELNVIKPMAVNKEGKVVEMDPEKLAQKPDDDSD